MSLQNSPIPRDHQAGGHTVSQGADFLAVWVESPEVHVPSGVEGGGGDAHSHPLCILGTKHLPQMLAEERLCHRRCKCGFSVTDFLCVFRNDF